MSETPQVILEIRDAQIHQGDLLILENVGFAIHKGEFVFLIGKTGSGKSSLLKTLYGELPLSSGEAHVAEHELRKIKRKKVPFLRRSLGIVFQDFQLLGDRSVALNLEFVLRATGWKQKKLIQDKIDEVLNLVGLQTKGFKFPHQLSGGEQQRVAIARALLNDPVLILADEPTGNLDPETSNNILNLLKDISAKGNAVLMATHDYSLIEKMKTRILKCENGTVTEAIGL
jgi:cell division transport system ATP-binding protein